MPRTILLISISTLITVIAWVSVEIYHTFNEVHISRDLQKNVSQQTYTFDNDKKVLLDELNKKSTIRYTHDQLNGK